jgi:hypothetical protein
MRNKLIKLPVILVLLFSLEGFSQTPEESKHPLLDKYYPQLNADTSKAVTTQIRPMPGTKSAPPVTTTTVPAVKPAPPVTTMTVPVETPAPPVTTTIVSAVTSEPAVTSPTVPDLTTTPSAITTPTVTTTPVMTITSAINKPTTVTTQAPVEKVQSQPAPPRYINTRLGSSTKQYDTWEKNNNGAGSVTTSPK